MKFMLLSPLLFILPLISTMAVSETIHFDYTKLTADVLAIYTPAGYLEFQTKWDISSIPEDVSVENAKLCLYIDFRQDYQNQTIDNDSLIYRINNQTWTESINYDGYNAQQKDTLTNQNFSSIQSNTWSCVDVTEQVGLDYAFGNIYTTFRIKDPDYQLINASAVIDQTTLIMGKDHLPEILYIAFRSAEHSNASTRPYLNVTYISCGGPIPMC